MVTVNKYLYEDDFGQKICPCCQGEIKKIMLNQRGTYYCPHCQKRRY